MAHAGGRAAIATQWQHFADAGYVTGIEPGNCRPPRPRLEPQARPLEYLQPGATREFHLEIAVLDGAEEITSRRVTGTRLLISSYFLGRAVAAM